MPQLNPQLPRCFFVMADRRDPHFGYLTPNRSPSPVLGSAVPTPSWPVPPYGWWHLGRLGHRDCVCLPQIWREGMLPTSHPWPGWRVGHLHGPWVGVTSQGVVAEAELGIQDVPAASGDGARFSLGVFGCPRLPRGPSREVWWSRGGSPHLGGRRR